MSQGMSQETYNTILNIRDAIALIAIITIVPTLSYRMAGIFLEQGLTKEYRETKQNLRETKRLKEYFQGWQNIYTELQREKAQRTEAQERREPGTIQVGSDKERTKRIQKLEKELQETTNTIKSETGEDVRYEMVQKKLYELTQTIDDLERKIRDIETQEIQYRFYTSLIVGVLSLLIGIFIPLLHIGIAFLIGGIITLGYGYWIYWDQMSSLLATISLIIALIGLVIGMWLYRPTEKS